MRKLEQSLKKYAKKFGETSAQAVVRWGVQTCRELAVETQVWGKTKTRDKQIGAITKDAYNVLLVVDKLEKASRGGGFRATNQGKSYHVKSDNVLADAEQVNWWIEINRTRRRSRTAVLPSTEKKVCDLATFKKAIRERAKAAGMAKGAWIGAGNDIAKKQKGADKITIGAGFLKYAQKHSGFGSSVAPTIGWNPKAKLTNKVRHSSDPNVISAAAFPKASAWGLKNTIRFYKKALAAIDKKS